MGQCLRTVHVTFTTVVADTIGDVLRRLGHVDPVIGLSANLSYGPINPPDPWLRYEWMRSKRWFESEDFVDNDPTMVERLWAGATAPDVAAVYWVCMTSPGEQACFLEFVSRMAGRAFDIVDATLLDDTSRDGTTRPHALGLMRQEAILAADLYAKRRRFTAAESADAVALWSRLREENAPFRVVNAGRLTSAPITHYDRLLCDQATQEWELAIQLIGRAVTALSAGPPGRATSPEILLGRLLALDGDGIEIEGAGPGLRDYRVRTSRPCGSRPARSPASAPTRRLRAGRRRLCQG